MKHILKILALTLLINFSLSKNTENICQLIDEKDSCKDKYGYRCDNDHCGIDQTSCNDHFPLNYINKFLKIYKNCPISSYWLTSHDWISKDVCRKSNFYLKNNYLYLGYYNHFSIIKK